MAEPWGRRDGESERAYVAFLAFLNLGEHRTVLDAYRQCKGKPEVTQTGGTWSRWVKDHRWFDRARDWDNHQARIRQEGEDRVTVTEAEEWARRRERARQSNWDAAQALRAKAATMLKFPIQRTTSEDGKTVIHPARWTFTTIGRFLALASQLEIATVGTAPASPGGPDAPNVDDMPPELAAILMKVELEWRRANARANGRRDDPTGQDEGDDPPDD